MRGSDLPTFRYLSVREMSGRACRIGGPVRGTDSLVLRFLSVRKALNRARPSHE